jgi:orotidine-5'-phosphate decarboxylase
MKPNPIIVALDVDSAEEARTLVAQLGSQVTFYKVGMELYAAAGMDFVRELIGQGKDVFLDLKLFDIPETVKRAVAVVARTGVKFLTLHSVASVMRAAVEGRGDSQLKLLAVTVLTSFGPEDMEDLGYECSVFDLVEERAHKAVRAGMDGIVCSPREASMVRNAVGRDIIIVTPGVRSAGKSLADQKRVATPAEAIHDGATHLVMGRQITRAADPAKEAEKVLEEIYLAAR